MTQSKVPLITTISATSVSSEYDNSDGRYGTVSPAVLAKTSFGKIDINGMPLEEWAKLIEKLLSVPRRNMEMERKYPGLKEVWDQYESEVSNTLFNPTLKAISDCYSAELEKYENWDTLKK